MTRTTKKAHVQQDRRVSTVRLSITIPIPAHSNLDEHHTGVRSVITVSLLRDAYQELEGGSGTGPAKCPLYN